MTIPPISRFWRLLELYKQEIRRIYIYALFIGIVNLTLPLGIQAIINYIQTGELTSSWVVLVSIVLVGIGISGILQVLQLRIVENIQQDIFARSAFEIAFRIPKINYFKLDKIHAPELVNRFFDTLTIQKGLPKILIDFSLAIFQIIFGLILLTIYSPYFIILGFALIFILWLIFRVTGPKGLATSLYESKYKYQLVYWLEEVARTTKSFKLHSHSNFHLNKTDGIVVDHLKSREKHFQVLLSQYRYFVGFKVFVAAGLLLLGGYLVFQEQMNIGQFVAAEIIIILIINSIEKVIRVVETIYDVLTALDKIGFVSDLELDKYSGIAIIENEDALSISAKEISFGFPADRYKVFEDLSFEINPKDRVLIQGKSGSGKTILLQILAGIFQVEKGELLINETPIHNYNRENFNNSIGVFLPTNQLFEGSIGENITMGRKISNKHLMQTVKSLQMSEYLNKLPKGLESQIESGGKSLPRAFIQKLMIARTLLTKPKLLLLEDPLQFINETEKKRIIDYIMSPEQNWTVLVISDYYYWEEQCNQILEMQSDN